MYKTQNVMDSLRKFGMGPLPSSYDYNDNYKLLFGVLLQIESKSPKNESCHLISCWELWCAHAWLLQSAIEQNCQQRACDTRHNFLNQYITFHVQFLTPTSK